MEWHKIKLPKTGNSGMSVKGQALRNGMSEMVSPSPCPKVAAAVRKTAALFQSFNPPANYN